jgi:hypothetical protein
MDTTTQKTDLRITPKIEHYQYLESQIQDFICRSFSKGLKTDKYSEMKRILNLSNPKFKLSFSNGVLINAQMEKESIKATSLLIRTYL